MSFGICKVGWVYTYILHIDLFCFWSGTWKWFHTQYQLVVLIHRRRRRRRIILEFILHCIKLLLVLDKEDINIWVPLPFNHCDPIFQQRKQNLFTIPHILILLTDNIKSDLKLPKIKLKFFGCLTLVKILSNSPLPKNSSING